MSAQIQQQLFNRAWSIEIGNLSAGTGKLYASPLSATIPTQAQGRKGTSSVLTAQGLPPTGLRVVFEIDKTSVQSSNKARIQVYNFSALSRMNYKKGYQVHLRAGYIGLVSTIYLGDIPESPKGYTSERREENIVTTLECGAAERQLKFSHFDKSYPPGTGAIQVFNDLADALDIPLGSVTGVTNKVYNGGLSLSGAISDSITMLCAPQGLEWNVDNGELRIYPIGTGVGSAIVLSKSTGLLGIPSEGGQFTVFSALLNPKILPGTIVRLVSQSVNGFFKIRRSVFRGDSEGDAWNVDCEAVQTGVTSQVTEQNRNGRIVA